MRKLLSLIGLMFLLLPLNSHATIDPTTLSDEERSYYIAYPTPHNTTSEKRKKIEWGEYLAKAGDCIACHTDKPNNGSPYAGGLGINTPFGIFYSPNITPHPEKGIGKWTDADFIRAMRNGLSVNHSNYFPVFPYPYFNILHDEDLLAIKAYLFSLSPNSRENRPNEVSIPFNIRLLQYGWKLLFFYPHRGEFKPNPKQSKEWNRGAYLVEGLGHCGMCHTPHNVLGGEKRENALTGNFVDGYFAPDISANGLADVSVEEIVSVFRNNKMLKGKGKIQGPMLDVNLNSLQYLTDNDLRSIAVYLKSVKSKLPQKKKSGAITADTGREIYEDKCATCHTTGAAGAPKLGEQRVWEPRLKQGIDTVVTHAVNGLNSMPPMGACMTCSKEEVKAAVMYMVNLEKLGNVVSSMAASSIPTQTTLTFEMGKKVYDKTCQVCHSDGKLGAPKFGDKAAWTPIVQTDMDILFSRALNGYKGMPPKGACYDCTNAEIMSAVKYMAQAGATQNDFSLW